MVKRGKIPERGLLLIDNSYLYGLRRRIGASSTINYAFLKSAAERCLGLPIKDCDVFVFSSAPNGESSGFESFSQAIRKKGFSLYTVPGKYAYSLKLSLMRRYGLDRLSPEEYSELQRMDPFMTYNIGKMGGSCKMAVVSDSYSILIALASAAQAGGKNLFMSARCFLETTLLQLLGSYKETVELFDLGLDFAGLFSEGGPIGRPEDRLLP